jgi:CysZ protein
MIQQPVSGAGYFLQGFGLLNRPGLRRFVAIPLTVNIVVFLLLIWFAAGQFDTLMDSLMPELPEWLAWLAWLLWVIFAVAIVVLVFFTFTIIANFIAAPFNGLLAEAVERHLTGQSLPTGGSLVEMLKDVPGTLLDELKKLGYFIAWAIPLLILFLIPGVNLIAPILWTLFSAWMLAIEYSDYPLGNHGVRSAQLRRILRERRWLTLGFGGATLVGTMIPVVNFLVMPAAVAGATAMWVGEKRIGHDK